MLIRPACKNPAHPGPRDTMKCASEPTPSNPYYVFWCPVCAEVLNAKSVQVLSSARYREEVKRKLQQNGSMKETALHAIPQRH